MISDIIVIEISVNKCSSIPDATDPASYTIDTNLILPDEVVQLLQYPSLSDMTSQILELNVDLLGLRPSWVLPLCGERAELLLEVDGREHARLEAFIFRQASVEVDIVNCPGR